MLRLGGLLGLAGAAALTVGTVGVVPASADTTSVDEPGDNLVPNPGLESVTNGLPTAWTLFNSGSQGYVKSSAEKVHSGAYSVRLDDPATTIGPGLRSAFIPITPGQVYEAEAYSYNVSGSSQFLLEFWSSGGARVAVFVGNNSQTGSWQQIRLSGTAPANATRATVLFYLPSANVGVSYFDDAGLWVTRWQVEVWGGDYLQRGGATDSLTITLAAKNDPVAFDRIDAFDRSLTFTSETRMSTSDGHSARWESGGGFRWDATHRQVVLAANTSGTLTIDGIRFSPPARRPFGKITVHESAGQQDIEIWTTVGGYSAPDHVVERQAAPAALAAARKASDYLETRRTTGGGVLMSHATWPGEPALDPQGNASVATGNLRLWQVTGEVGYRDRAVATLDWLAGVQLDSGGFGFPWAWGGSKGHFAYAGHYPENGTDHPKGTPYAIITSNAAQALLEGYHALGRQEYLDGCVNAVHYLLHDHHGFQWLDDAQTIGSIPYCTIDPVDAQGGKTTNIYNIDGSSLELFTALYRVRPSAELRVYGDAIARNLLAHIEPNGANAYAWYAPSNLSTGYAAIVYRGLMSWGTLREREPWVARARQGISWMTNVDEPATLLWEDDALAYGGLDNTDDVIGFLQGLTSTQRADGSWTGGTTTRTDSGNMTVIARLLRQMDYQP